MADKELYILYLIKLFIFSICVQLTDKLWSVLSSFLNRISLMIYTFYRLSLVLQCSFSLLHL